MRAQWLHVGSVHAFPGMVFAGNSVAIHFHHFLTSQWFTDNCNVIGLKFGFMKWNFKWLLQIKHVAVGIHIHSSRDDYHLNQNEIKSRKVVGNWPNSSSYWGRNDLVFTTQRLTDAEIISIIHFRQIGIDSIVFLFVCISHAILNYLMQTHLALQ